MTERSTLSLWAISLGLCLGLSACGGGTSSNDAGMDTGTVDAGPQPSVLYGACTTDSQCPGADGGGICRKNVAGWPQGFCTVTCADRSPCDDGISYNDCLLATDGNSYCERKCLNGFDCSRDGYTCAFIGSIAPSGGECVPQCSTDEQCGDGAKCDNASGACIAVSASLAAGGNVGDPCTMDSQCKSGARGASTNPPVKACHQEVRASGPTGYIGGYCIEGCVLPAGYNTSTLFAGTALPQSTCGANQVCFLSGNNQAQGDLGVCLKECTQNSDCRSGYSCQKSFQLQGGTSSFTNGVCLPVTCPGEACPSGYTCDTTSGVCHQ